MGMFCYQCQETAGGKGCTVRGVCGKNEEVAKLQDLLIYITKGISEIVISTKTDIASFQEMNHDVIRSLFITITNANYDADAIEKQIITLIRIRDYIATKSSYTGTFDAA